MRFLYIASYTAYFLFILTIQRIMKPRKKNRIKKEKKKEIKEKFGFCYVFLCTYVAISDQ